MFKNKKGLYLLIAVNIAVWSFFIYRFYMAYNETDAPTLTESVGTIKAVELSDSVTYKLNLDYKDPFLKDVAKSNYKEKTDPNKQKVVVIKTPTVAITKQLPDIKYLGLVKNSSSGVATALISLNGQSKLVKLNDVIDGITFKSFNKDSLIAKWGKEKIVVKR